MWTGSSLLVQSGFLWLAVVLNISSCNFACVSHGWFVCSIWIYRNFFVCSGSQSSVVSVADVCLPPSLSLHLCSAQLRSQIYQRHFRVAIVACSLETLPYSSCRNVSTWFCLFFQSFKVCFLHVGLLIWQFKKSWQNTHNLKLIILFIFKCVVRIKLIHIIE